MDFLQPNSVKFKVTSYDRNADHAKLHRLDKFKFTVILWPNLTFLATLGEDASEKKSFLQSLAGVVVTQNAQGDGWANLDSCIHRCVRVCVCVATLSLCNCAKLYTRRYPQVFCDTSSTQGKQTQCPPQQTGRPDRIFFLVRIGVIL